MRTLSATALSSMFSQQTDEVWLMLLTLTHASFGAPIRLVNNTESIVSRGNTFVACPFKVDRPPEDQDTLGEARISIDGVDQSIVAAVRQISGPPDALVEVILASAPDSVELAVDGLKLRNISYEAQTITGTLRYEDIMVEPITLQMTPNRFPGLF